MTQTSKFTFPSPRHAARRRRPIDARLDADLFRALADPTRVRLLSCLAKCGRPCSVSEVAECCSVDFSVVSRHLQTLARAGVLTSSKEGRTVAYRVRTAELCAALRGLADAFEQCCPADGSKGCCG